MKLRASWDRNENGWALATAHRLRACERNEERNARYILQEINGIARATSNVSDANDNRMVFQ